MMDEYLGEVTNNFNKVKAHVYIKIRNWSYWERFSLTKINAESEIKK